MSLAKEDVTWDLRSINTPLELGDKLFLFLMLAIVVIVGFKLFRVFQLSRASRLRKLTDPAILRHSLEKIYTSLRQWLFVPPFAWGLLASSHLYSVCDGLLISKSISKNFILDALRELATDIYIAILVSFAVFLARWYVLKRLEKASG